MTVLELIDELKRYDNEYVVFFKETGDDADRYNSADFVNSPGEKELTLEFYGL